MVDITIPAEYGYVVLSALLGAMALNIFLSFKVMKARKVHDVQYPMLYSPTNEQFNCVQRAHQNFLEIVALFLISSLIAGVFHPLKVTVLNVVFITGRVIYAYGYYTGDPEKRQRGGMYVIAYLGNFVLAAHGALMLAGVL